MTLPISELTGRDLAAAVAREVCGWKSFEFTRDDGSTFRHFIKPEDVSGHFFQEKLASGIMVEVESGDEENAPPYDTDLNACREAEAIVLRRGLGDEYGDELRDLVGEIEETTRTNWRLECAMASAETRCHAMLAVVRNAGSTDGTPRT